MENFKKIRDTQVEKHWLKNMKKWLGKLTKVCKNDKRIFMENCGPEFS